MSVAITLRGCAKTWPGGTKAVWPLDLEIAAGETLVLLGPSGCGKTTLLRLIAGLEAPDAGGQVLFDGEDVTRLPIERRNVGMVFQSYALFPNMDVAANIGYGLKVRGVPKPERAEKVGMVARVLEILPLLGRKPRAQALTGCGRGRARRARRPRQAREHVAAVHNLDVG